MIRAWKNRWLTTFKHRIASAQQMIPVDLRYLFLVFVFAGLAIVYTYASMLWSLWNTALRISVGINGLMGILNGILTVLFFLLIGQTEWKRAIERIQFIAAANLLLELGGLAVSGMQASREVGWSRDVVTAILFQIGNLIFTLGLLRFAHSLERNDG